VSRSFEGEVAKALGHPPPFSPEEIAAFDGALRLVGLSDLEPLSKFRNLQELRVVGCEGNDLAFLSTMPRLRRLAIVATPIRDCSALLECEGLESLDLAYTKLEDATAATRLPNAKVVRVTGAPLNDSSYRALQTASQEGHAVLGLFRKEDWLLTRWLHDRGVNACCGVYDLDPLFVRSGVSRMANAEVDYAASASDLVRALFDQPGFTLDGYFEFLGLGNRTTDSPVRSFNDEHHIELGYANAARAWTADVEPPIERNFLRLFVTKYPDVLFYREDGSLAEAAEQRYHVQLPHWFHGLRRALAFVMPYHGTSVRFSADITENVFGDDRDAWFDLGLRGIDSPGLQPILEVNKLFAIATHMPQGDTVLAIRLDNESRRSVFRYSLEDQRSDGTLSEDAIRPCCGSYAELLANISAIRLNGTTTLEART
jgi:hypothetical protein